MSLEGKVTSLLSGTASAESAPAGSGAPPSGASGVDSAPAGSPASPEIRSPAAGDGLDAPGGAHTPAGATNEEAALQRQILAEKLAKTRAEARAKLDDKAAQRARKEAEKLRAEAESEKEKLTKSLRSGTFLETVKALGLDPSQAFREMQDEAVKAGTPEAQMRVMQERFEAEIKATRAELEAEKKAREERDKAEEEERQRQRSRAMDQRFTEDFSRTVKAPAFGDLLDEYGDDRLLRLADNLRRDTDSAIDAASQLGVRLTDPARGLTMTEILSVLAAAQRQHEAQKNARRTARTGAPQTEPVPHPGAQQATVNGTTDRRNAEPSTIGNNIATATASAGKAPLRATTPAGRVQEKARMLVGRRK